MHKFVGQFLPLLIISLMLSSCGGENGPTNEAHQTAQQPNFEPPIALIDVPDMQIRGQLTYDRVHFSERRYQGLNYRNIETMPIRGVTVQLLDDQGRLLSTTLSDHQGAYRLDALQGQTVQVRVKAELVGSTTTDWEVQVKDNTRGNAHYVLDGSLTDSGATDLQVRNLHAPAGWTGNHYGEARSAGPFAILDSVYDAVQKVVQAVPDIQLPPLNIYWSERNITTRGNLAEGHLGTSFYTTVGPSIYLLGAEDNDSDEYDRAVIQHEFGHYLEHQIGRNDNIGGRHSQSVSLDMRVAFGEAFGNAFAGLASGDPVYRDSMGLQQSWGYAFDVQQRPTRNQGWFNQASIQTILYQLADSAPEHLGLGFASLYQALSSEPYQNFEGFASIYALSAQLQAQNPKHADAIAQLVSSFNIHGTGWYGEGETNNAGSSVVLPVYHRAELGRSINLCSDNKIQNFNGVDVRRFVRIYLPQSRSYQIAAVATQTEMASPQPQLRIYRQGRQVASILNGRLGQKEAIHSVEAGHHIIELYEKSNADGNRSTGGLACFDITVY